MVNRDSVITKEKLDIIFLLDNSYSMINGPIAQLNHAFPIVKDNLMKVADDQNVELRLRVIVFSDDAIWKIGTYEEGEKVEDIVWKDLDVVGGTSTPKAINEANKALKKEYLGAHALHPIVILCTDGCCNPDEKNDYTKSINEMKQKLSGNTGKEKVTRIAIGVGNYNRDELVEFASEGLISDIKQSLVFDVDDTTNLGKVINWVAVSSMYSSITDDDVGVPDLGDPDWYEED